MRIALVGARNYPAAHGGIEVAVEHLAKEFGEMGHDVHIFVGHDRSDDARIRNSESATIHYTKAVKSKYVRTASQIVNALPAIRKISADVVHVHGVGPAFPLALTRDAFKSDRVVVTSHGMDWERSKWSGAGKLAFQSVATRALAEAGNVTAVSQDVADTLTSLIKRRVIYVPNGYSHPTSASNYAASLDQSSYSVMVARLSPEKNIEFAINAYDGECVEKLGQLIVVGSGGSSHSHAYEKTLRNLRNREVKFTGPLPREDVISLLRSATRYISASILEAQPLSVIEAMASGAPMALSDIQAHRELADGIATFFDPHSSESFKNAVLNDNNLSLKAENGKRRSDEFSWLTAANQYLKVYDQANIEEESVTSKRRT